MNLQLIGLTGLAGSGKDVTAALLGMLGYDRRAFADPLREEVREIITKIQNGIAMGEFTALKAAYGPDVIWAIQNKVIQPDDVWRKPTFPLMRQLLQKHGTEYRRAQDPEYWIKKVFANWKADLPKEMHQYAWPWVISDVRFPNEVEAIHARGGQVWRIVRPDVKPLETQHSSETGIADLTVDREILNDGSLWDLQKKVQEALNSK